MNCRECQELLEEYALDALTASDADQVAKHLADGCETCRQRLKMVRGSWGELAGTLKPVTPPSHLKSELLDRIHAESKPSVFSEQPIFSPQPEPEVLKPLPRTPTNTRSKWSLLPYIAATLSGIAAGAIYSVYSDKLPSDAGLAAQHLAQLSNVERSFGASQIRLAALHTHADQPEVQGHLIWDATAGQLHVYAFALDKPPTDAIYRLWFVSQEEVWTPVGDLEMQPDGVCTAIFDLPQEPIQIERVAITLESTDAQEESDNSRGPVQLEGGFTE